MKKVFSSPCFAHVLLLFTGKNKYSNVLNGNIHGTSTGPVARRPRDRMMGRSGEVRGTSVIHFFKIQLKNILNLLWQFTQDFIVNCSREKASEQYSD